MNSNNITILEFIDTLFSKPAANPCSFAINSHLTNIDYETNRHKMLPILMNILILGAKKLFGNAITANNITPEEFAILQNYFKSFGFIIKYEIITNENIPHKINIWFEKYKAIRTCNGIVIYQK